MKEIAVFEKFLTTKKLKHSKPREWIINVFLGLEKHVTIDELWTTVKKQYPSVGYATVYRTMKLLSEIGLCTEIRFEDGTVRYEHHYAHDHHDHLMCTKCGRLIEVVDKTIEKLQDKLMQKHGFLPQFHRMNLYGVCRECRENKHKLADGSA
jgi:Fur family transcriptional regulator, ferric uptake regulator